MTHFVPLGNVIMKKCVYARIQIENDIKMRKGFSTYNIYLSVDLSVYQ